MGELQTKGYIENLNLLFERLECINRIELIPRGSKESREVPFSCCIQYKPGRMKTSVKLQTLDKGIITIDLTEISSVEFFNGKTTIKGTHYDIY